MGKDVSLVGLGSGSAKIAQSGVAESSTWRGRLRAFALLPIMIATAVIAAPVAAVAADVPETGDFVWVGGSQGYGGTSLHAIYGEAPTDPDNPGTPAFWAYCIEHDVSARSGTLGEVGDFSSYLGDNLVVDASVQAKVLWVLAHSYPALSLAQFGIASGVPGISENDAIEATQYAIWRYTDVGYDALWAWETPDSETAYWYLVNGANASSGMTPDDFETTVSIIGPAAAQVAGTLVGPFTVTTNQTSVSVVIDPVIPVTDAAGNAIDTSVVVDGQQLFLDLRSTTAPGSATLTASALGTSATGRVISVPTASGELTEDNHAQTIILVTASPTSTTAETSVAWTSSVSTPSEPAPQTLPATGAEAPIGALVLGVLGIAVGIALTVARRKTSS